MRWLRRLWHKSLTERRLDSELQFHVEQQAAKYIAAGLPHDEARRLTSIEFGGVERFKEECREARWENRLDILARDLQFAFRGLLKDRRFACIAIFPWLSASARPPPSSALSTMRSSSRSPTKIPAILSSSGSTTGTVPIANGAVLSSTPNFRST
jgi:hypothetical protein